MQQSQTQSQQTFLTSLMQRATRIFLFVGISALTVAATQSLAASVVLQENGSLRYEILEPKGKVTQALELHQAAIPLSQEEDQSARVLFVGMLLLLAAFVSYAMVIVRQERELQRSPWRRVKHWFQERMDRHIGTYPRF